jgi:hypothetical protein
VDLPEITEVKRLTLRPGDSVIVRLEYDPSMDEVDGIQAGVLSALGRLDYVPPVLVLGPRMDIEVIGPPDADTT